MSGGRIAPRSPAGVRITKGPSLDPVAKRLAVEVKDHSLEYNDDEARPGIVAERA